MPAHQLHYQCLPWRVHPHSVSNTHTHTHCSRIAVSWKWSANGDIASPSVQWGRWQSCFINSKTSLSTGLTTTLPMWWLMGNQWTWACGIQQDRRTTTGSGLCPTHRQYVYISAFTHSGISQTMSARTLFSLCPHWFGVIHWPVMLETESLHSAE